MVPYINDACSEEIFSKIVIKNLVLQFELVTSSNRLTIGNNKGATVLSYS